MTTRADVVAAARSLLGTPYAPHQRTPGVGIDCAGLPIVVARLLGLKEASFDVNGYSLHPDGSLIPLCKEHLIQVPREEMGDGDVLVLKWGKGEAQHFGILATHQTYGTRSIIHAEQLRHKQVVEHQLAFTAHTRFVAAFRFPGVECRS